MAKVTWSHSSLKDYEGCARRYHEVKILKKYPFQETEATRYGTQLHLAAEEHIRDDKPLPPQFAFIQSTLDALKKKPGRKLAEQKMALDEELCPVGWFDKKVWVRGIADLLILDDDNLTAWVVDYKTGNNKYPDREQLVLMSLMVFRHYPHIREVKSALLFVVKEDMVKHSMSIDDAEAEWWKYRERVGRIAASMEADVWNPTRTPLCGYCPVQSCEFNKRH
jgi:RecB family exonuclease